MSSHSDSVTCCEEDGQLTPLHEKMLDFDFESTTKVSAWTRSNTIKNLSFSPTSTLRILPALCRPLLRLTPSFVRHIFQKEHSKSEPLHITAYMDGMRGLAAFTVFICHLSYGTFDISHVYGGGREEGMQNYNFLQLPIVRLFYAGPPMVAIFFVISGYALSYKPLRSMRTQQHDFLLQTLSSSVFRRALRLYLPCFVSTFLVACMASLGWYQWTEDFAKDMRAVEEFHPWTAPTVYQQFTNWIENMFQFVNIFDWSLYSGNTGLDVHLWTIPTEFRCSMALFLSHLLVARMTSRTRMLTYAFLIWWVMQWDRWDLIPFWAGAIMAELELNRSSQPVEQSLLKHRLHKAFYYTVFIVGLYLASFPDASGHDTPGYIVLNALIPENFTQKHRFWPNFGAIMIVWATSNLSFIRNIFTTAPLQYLGKISFPLYLVHGPIIHTFGYALMDEMLSITGYDENQDFAKLRTAFVCTACAVIMVVIWCADIFLRAVDVHCVRFAKWLETKFFDS